MDVELQRRSGETSGEPLVGKRADPVTDDDRRGDGVPARADLRAGVAMRAIAAFGVVVAVVSGFIGWRALGDVERSVDRSLAVGEDAAATLRETIELADGVLATLDSGLATLAGTLGTVRATVDDTSGVAAATASLAGSLPDGLDEVDVALATVEDLAGTIDTVLGALSQVPFGPEYDPDVSFPDAIADVRAAFDPVSRDLSSISDELADFAGRSGEIEAQIDALGRDLADARVALAESDLLLDSYRRTADDAGDVATTSRDDLGGSLTLARMAVVLLAALIAVAQYVPWWLGTRLRRTG